MAVGTTSIDSMTQNTLTGMHLLYNGMEIISTSSPVTLTFTAQDIGTS